ncbi:MAG: D-glycero-beta-D-manno-heptose 1,7-bisphosphate 7-phosphatase [Methylococcaceae bacterium]|jgi:D-glycero-D-manno-heptose 1,7-bisphosphate phosphatase
MPKPLYVLIDRDGVINHESDAFIKSPDEWLPIAGSLEAIALFNQHGYQVVVITNQSGIGRGLLDNAMLESIHSKMQKQAAEKNGLISRIYFCPHRPDEQCLCRKPKPGLILRFASDTHADLANTYFIGDSLRDIDAALAAGAKPILVKTGRGLDTLKQHPDINIPIFENLYDAASQITSRQ